jgi:hypothetical protein
MGKLAQLQHTAYSPQQPASSEHMSQLAASSQSRPQKQWHKRHMSRTPASPPRSPSGASACPLAHCREKSTFFGHTRPPSSNHSVLKLCGAIKRRLDGRNVPRHAGLAPSAATSTVHRPVSSSKPPRTTPIRPFICGAACKPSMRTREPSFTVAAACAGDCGAEEDGADSEPDVAVAAADAGDGIATSAASQIVISMAVGAGMEGATRRVGGARVECGCVGAQGLPHASSTAVKMTPSVASAAVGASLSRRMQPARHSVRCRPNALQKAVCARNCSALAFQHQLKRRRVAAHAVGRQAEQPLHVSNRAARRRLDNKQASAIAARGSNRHLNCIRRENRACSVGGGGRLLH